MHQPAFGLLCALLKIQLLTLAELLQKQREPSGTAIRRLGWTPLQEGREKAPPPKRPSLELTLWLWAVTTRVVCRGRHAAPRGPRLSSLGAPPSLEGRMQGESPPEAAQMPQACPVAPLPRSSRPSTRTPVPPGCGGPTSPRSSRVGFRRKTGGRFSETVADCPALWQQDAWMASHSLSKLRFGDS